MKVLGLTSRLLNHQAGQDDDGNALELLIFPNSRQRLAAIHTGSLSDALGSVGVLAAGLRPITPGARVIGPAFTVKCYPGSIITVHKALLEARPGLLTTPESLELNALLHAMVNRGCTSAVMEVSSHALAQDRVHGLHFACGVFTMLRTDGIIGATFAARSAIAYSRG